MTEWLGTLRQLAAEDTSSVLVTVGRIRGSAPRETGARMIVTAQHTIGSIGGGELEYCATRLACDLLGGEDERTAVSKRTFPLGPDLGQCCGGVVDVVFERLPGSKSDWLERAYRCHDARVPAIVATRAGAGSVVITADDKRDPVPAAAFALVDEMLAGRSGATVVDDMLLVPLAHGTIDVAVFGAGHVGAAVVDLLARFDCNVRWIDSRRRIFPAAVPARVTAIESDDPAREAAAVPPGAYCVVMTHSHPMDLSICEKLLARDDLLYTGLIGSRSKRRRFEKRLAAAGLTADRLEKLVCPIGVGGIAGKQPAEIALAVVAQILQVRDARHGAATRPGSLEVVV